MQWIALLAASAACAATVGAPLNTARIGHRSEPFYGLDVPNADIRTARALNDSLGFRPSVLSVFVRLDSMTTSAKVASIAQAGYEPFVTLEPWHAGFVSGAADPGDSLAELLSGRFDSQIIRQAEALAVTDGPFYIRFAHEMNASWYPWGSRTNGNTADQYIAAWRRVHALVDSVVGHRAIWVWSPVSVAISSVDKQLRNFYPGDDVVDAVGFTAYEHAADDPGRTFDETLLAVHSFGKPVLLSEIGCDSPGRNRWLSELGPFLKQHTDIAGFVYFDTDAATTGATGSYSLGDRQARAAFASSLGRIGAQRSN